MEKRLLHCRICVTTPFPYPYAEEGEHVRGLPIYIDENISPEELKDIHLDEVSSKDGTLNTLYVSGTSGSCIYITGLGDTVDKARERAYNLIEKVSIPKMFYRHDIGVNFMSVQLPKLQSLGYLKKMVL